MACRNPQKAEKARQAILHKVPRADVQFIPLNLSSLSSVRIFANSIIEKFDRLDVLINNAGIMIPPFSKTDDGFESQMGVNYFSHFLLTKLLFPLLNKTEGSRIVSLSSIAHKQGKINFENLNAEKGYSKIDAYGQSKLACLMFAYELQRRIDGTGSKVLSLASHPGVSSTELSRHISKFLYYPLYPLFMMLSHNPYKGSLPTLMAALDPDAKGGDYYGPTGFGEMVGKPGKTESLAHSHDTDVAKKLWEVSEKLVSEKFNLV
jgi:NAD(P)-dependent dehydrogenase (short-subunit alcohol dehydrogenase family)